MSQSALTPVEFHGASLFITTIDNVPFVAMRPITQALGLDWAAQFTRIKRHPVLSICVAVTTTQMPGDDQGVKFSCCHWTNSTAGYSACRSAASSQNCAHG